MFIIFLGLLPKGGNEHELQASETFTKVECDLAQQGRSHHQATSTPSCHANGGGGAGFLPDSLSVYGQRLASKAASPPVKRGRSSRVPGRESWRLLMAVS